MDLSSDNNRVWLVKSSGMIMGPFSMEEVIKSLEERRVSIIDEIRSPSSRWSFIREHAKFKEIVQFLREQQSLAKEDTGLTNSGTKTITNTGLGDEVTVTPVMPPQPEPQEDETVEVLETSRNRSQEKPMTYAFSADQSIQKNLRRRNRRFAFVAWTAFVIVVTVLVGIQFMGPQPAPKSLTADDYLRLAKSNRTLGNLESALEFFRKAETFKVLDANSQLQMIPLLMKVENQNVLARQMLEQISLESLNDKNKNQVASLLALSYLREGQLDEAEKRYQALAETNPELESNQLNLIEISILKGQFDAAVKSLTEMSKAGAMDLNILLYRALAHYRSSDSSVMKDRLENSLADLRRYQEKTQDYKPENLLLTLAIQKRLGLDLDAGATAVKLINVHPDLTREHNHDELVHGEVLQWNYLANICQTVVKDGSASPAYQGLESYCLYQSGNLKGALEKIEKARAQFSKENMLVGLHAFLLMKTGQGAEASALFKLPKSDAGVLAHDVHARWCASEKDWNCAESEWKKIQRLDERSVEVFLGLSQISIARGQKDMAADFVQQGLLISGNYRPLLVVKDQLQ